MSRDVDWTYLAWKDLLSLHWRTAGKVCRAVYDFAANGTGTLRNLPADERLGATHSLVFAIALGAVVGLAAPRFGRPAVRTALMATAVLASHALLDTLTDGGLGCALFWPSDLTRYFAPWTPLHATSPAARRCASVVAPSRSTDTPPQE